MCFIQKVGKIFEQNWKKSCPDWLFVHRPPDAAQSFDMSSKLRFSQHSPADFFMFDGEKLYTLECKTFMGSCSFERDKNDKGIIHWYQIESLTKFSSYKNVISGFLLDFRTSENTYFLFISDFNKMIQKIFKKSFNEKDMLLYCNPILINKEKLRVNYRYDVEKFLINATNNYTREILND